jgi:hypothetical protein
MRFALNSVHIVHSFHSEELNRQHERAGALNRASMHDNAPSFSAHIPVQHACSIVLEQSSVPIHPGRGLTQKVVGVTAHNIVSSGV